MSQIEDLFFTLLCFTVPDFEPPSENSKNISVGAIVGIVAGAAFFIVIILGILWRKRCFGGKHSINPGNVKWYFYMDADQYLVHYLEFMFYHLKSPSFVFQQNSRI